MKRLLEKWKSIFIIVALVLTVGFYERELLSGEIKRLVFNFKQVIMLFSEIA